MKTLKNEYYVYMYLRENDSEIAEKGTPYYVGKGKGDRAFSNHRYAAKPKDENNIIYVYENMTEQEAFEKEKELISKYGRVDNNTGILRNMTDGGEGGSGRWNPDKYIAHSPIKIQCIETGVIFENFKEVMEWISTYHKTPKKITYTHVKKVCDGKLEKVYGYHWKYVDKDIPQHKKKKPSKPVRCVDLNIEFESLSAAGQYIRNNFPEIVTSSSPENTISKCCRGIINIAYNFKWEFVFDTHKNNISSPRGSYGSRPNKNSKKVKCITNGMIFESMSSAIRWLEDEIGKKTSIRNLCGNKKSFYGYRFMYEGEDEPSAPLSKGEVSKKKVLCVETNIIFDSLKEAGLWAFPEYKSENSGRRMISQCCNGNRETAGGYTWKFIEIE